MLMSELQTTRHVARLYLSLDIIPPQPPTSIKVGGLIPIYPHKSKHLF
jgi:hypothetical protein